jgi:hypothetical protein
MRDIIHRHNLLNGVVFSVVEFGLIALLIGAFATYYLLHHRPVMAAIGWGIALNCLPVVVSGVQELRRRNVSGQRLGSFWDKAARERHRKENPHMLRDALVLTGAVMLPFVCFALVLFEPGAPSKH